MKFFFFLGTGTKSFMLGEEPSEIDCSVFGFLAEIYWTIPNTPIHEFVTSKYDYER